MFADGEKCRTEGRVGENAGDPEEETVAEAIEKEEGGVKNAPASHRFHEIVPLTSAEQSPSRTNR